MNHEISYTASDILHIDWSDSARQRLRAAIERRGLIKEVAAAVGMMPNALSAMLKPGSSEPSASRLARLCAAVGVSTDYILTARRADDADVSAVVEVDLAYGLGATYLDGQHPEEMYRLFPTDWLRQYTAAPAKDLLLARGIGDSMAPTIMDGDTILIDRSQSVPRLADQIWAFGWSGMGMVKRLRGHPDGQLKLISDNPSVPDELVPSVDVEIVGRIVAIVRKM